MFKLIRLPLIALLFLIGTSCDDQLDINEDPLAATQVDANLLMPEILVNLSNNREAELAGAIGTLPQYYEPSARILGDYALGLRTATFTVGNTWSTLYVTALKNAALMEQTAREAEPGTRNNIIAQAMIIKSFIFFMATTLYEDVPYTQAADLVTDLPIYDAQETVMRGVASDLAEAVTLIDDSSLKVESGDLLFNGDMEGWRRMANSLRFKVLMYIANVDPGSVSSEIAALADQPLIETAAQNAQLDYLDSPGNQNPFWNIIERFSAGENEFYYASEASFNLITVLNDPRKRIYFDERSDQDSVGTGNYGVPVSPGSFSSAGGEASALSLAVLRPDRPDTYITAAETMLLKAEAIVRGLADGDAQEAFEAGIRSSIDEYDGTNREVAAEDVTAYIETLPNVNDSDDDDALLAIRQQHYIANFQRLPEGWAEWRRTKVPTLEVPSGSLVGDIVRRFFYPPDEVGANPNAPAPEPLAEPMWYEN